MLGYLSLDIICSSKLTIFLELRSRKTVRFSDQIMSGDKCPSIFSRQMKAIVYISVLRECLLSCGCFSKQPVMIPIRETAGEMKPQIS